MNQIIKIAWDLNENTENRYQLVYEIAELAKKLVDENQAKKAHDDFSFEENFDTTYKKDNENPLHRSRTSTQCSAGT